MLKLILPMSIMLLMSSSNWWSITNSIILLSFLFLGSTHISANLFMLSTMSLMDNMSTTLIILTMLISTMMLLASTKILNFNMNSKLFMLMVLALMLILSIAFSSSSLMMFYIWFEASLIPTLFIILLWGYQPERMQASMYLMMYTISSSLPMLLMIMLMITNNKTSNMLIQFLPSTSWHSSIPWLLLILGFLVKLPMYTSHLWLPKAHVEAPIAGSMILAAILLKLGGYGLIRMSILHHKSLMPTNLLITLSCVGALLTSLICLRQPDMKSMIAYSSVGHMGLLIAGAMSMTSWGINGAMFMMIAHGLSSSGLFALANLSYSLTHTRSSFMTKGMMALTPSMSMWWFLLLAANMAAPPTLNLMSEIMLLTSILSKSMIMTLILASISFFAATYSLHLFTITQHGKPMNITNPLSSMSTQDYLLMMSHVAPLLLLVIKPEIMMI